MQSAKVATLIKKKKELKRAQKCVYKYNHLIGL